MNVKKPKGTRDYYGTENSKLELLLSIVDDVSFAYGFNKMTLPTFEDTALFSRTVGETTDVVNKEMYTFEDKKGRSLSLKPEGTASATRSVLENKLVEQGKEQRMFYIERMFRYERPQKGRQREFIQLGAEWYNSTSIDTEVQVIQYAREVLYELGIDQFVIELNTIGTSSERSEYKEELKKYYESNSDKLSKDSQSRVSGNVLRILDSKLEEDIKVNEGAPSITSFISKEELERFEEIKILLNNLKVEYVVNDKLIRGLDYYNGLVFELISTDTENLGTKSTLIGGGRYDTLATQLDSSKNIPAIGFAAGIERLMLASNIDEGVVEMSPTTVITTDKEYTLQALQAAERLRMYGVATIIDNTDNKLAKKFQRAEKSNSKIVIIVGKESKDLKLTVKDLELGTEETIEAKDLIDTIGSIIEASTKELEEH